MNNFQEMGLSPLLMQSLEKLGFVQPTSIQAHTIPLALQQKDILGSAQTGTGKTLAFALPLINNLLNNPTGMGLILAPTRELAQQVLANINQLLPKNSSIKTALIIGGEPYAKQLAQLRLRPRIIIGTPGRIIDHLGRGSLKVDNVNFLVLDETDRMFDLGFSIQLEKIISQVPTQRQTLMFSATFPPDIERLAAKHMRSPERVFVQEIQDTGLVAKNLTQEKVEVKKGDKYEELLNQLTSREGTVLVFVKMKSDADRLAIQLGQAGHNVCAMHGNLRQNKRERVIKFFRQGKYRIMVGTDIVARGLDVPHVKHVINYDIPHSAEDYVHRIGRTARAGAEGFAVSFVSDSDRKHWDSIQNLIDPSAEKPKPRGGRTFSNHTRPYLQDNNRSYSRDRRTYAPGNNKPYSQDRKPYGQDNNKPYSQDRRSGTASTRENHIVGARLGYPDSRTRMNDSNWSDRPLGGKKYGNKQRYQ